MRIEIACLERLARVALPVGVLVAGLGTAGAVHGAESLIFGPRSAVQADIDIVGGLARFDGVPAYTDSFFTVGGAARANVPFAAGWNFQADVQFLSFVEDGSTDTAAGKFLHLYRRSGPTALGAFAGFASLDMAPYGGGIAAYFLGAEAQFHGDRWMLYLQGGGISLRRDYDPFHAFFLRGQATYFLTANTSLAGDVMYAGFSDQFVNDMLTVALTGIYRLTDSPFALFVQARYDRFLANEYYVGDVTSGLFGFRLNIDPRGSTTRSHALTGPAMNVLLPYVHGGAI